MVDLVFLGDIVINFFLMYIERETGQSHSKPYTLNPKP